MTNKTPPTTKQNKKLPENQSPIGSAASNSISQSTTKQRIEETIQTKITISHVKDMIEVWLNNDTFLGQYSDNLSLINIKWTDNQATQSLEDLVRSEVVDELKKIVADMYLDEIKTEDFTDFSKGQLVIKAMINRRILELQK